MLDRSIARRACHHPERTRTDARGETAIDLHHYLMNQAELEQFLCYAIRHFSGLDFGGHDALYSILKLHTDGQLSTAERSILACPPRDILYQTLAGLFRCQFALDVDDASIFLRLTRRERHRCPVRCGQGRLFGDLFAIRHRRVGSFERRRGYTRS